MDQGRIHNEFYVRFKARQNDSLQKNKGLRNANESKTCRDKRSNFVSVHPEEE